MKQIVKMVFGSHMYGLNTPESDLDYKGIYLPELSELMLGTAAKHINQSTGNDKSKNSKDDIDDELFSLGEFLKLAMKGETVALDMLHANPDLATVAFGDYGDIWKDLVSKRHMFYTTNLKAYMGYVKRQAAKYGLKGSRISAMREAIEFLKDCPQDKTLYDFRHELPENEFAKKVSRETSQGEQNFYEVNGKKYQDTNSIEYTLERIETALDSYGARALLAEKNEGVDWKAVSHALRAGYQLRSILNVGTFSYPLAETEFLRNVKSGNCDYKTEVSDVLENLIEEIDELVLVSDLPSTVDVNYWNKWLLDVYTDNLIEPICKAAKL